MTRVLFVCLGNICRSPMAEGVLRARLAQTGRTDIEVDSAGTGAWHVGEPPDPRTLAELDKHGISLDSRARQLRRRDGEDFDVILCADDSNVRDVKAILDPRHHHKVHKMLAPTTGADVPDPYYGGVDGFAEVYRLLDEAIQAWLERW